MISPSLVDWFSVAITDLASRLSVLAIVATGASFAARLFGSRPVLWRAAGMAMAVVALALLMLLWLPVFRRVDHDRYRWALGASVLGCLLAGTLIFH